MSAVDFKEIPAANSADGYQDTFEMFARDLLWSLGCEIEEGPSRGPDGGKDLIVIEPLNGILGNAKRRWLVSCKHYAHSGSSVGESQEIDILGRVQKFHCDGFMAFYSTIPSSALFSTFSALKDRIAIEVLDRARIEYLLLSTDRLRGVLRRYLPESYKHVTQSYTWEKFFTAVLTLATGQSSLKDRLADAYISALIRLRPDDLPGPMREEFAELKQALTNVEPIGGEGRVFATVKDMEELEARELAERIVNMYDRYRVNLIEDMRT